MEKKNIWVLINPDNGHWDEEFAQETITSCAESAGVSVHFTGRTRDTGFGQEKQIVVKGNERDIEFFESRIDESLY